MLESISRLMKKDVPQAQLDEQKKVFCDVKNAVRESALLTYPKVGKLFILHLDATDYQDGAQLTQCDLTIGLCLAKLTAVQREHLAIHKELLVADKGF